MGAIDCYVFPSNNPSSGLSHRTLSLWLSPQPFRDEKLLVLIVLPIRNVVDRMDDH